jgi:hypothetical protein
MSKANLYQRMYAPLAKVIIWSCLILMLGAIPSKASTLSSTEAWVLSKLNAGETAAFDAHLPEARRTIGGSFLAELMTDSEKAPTVPKGGLYISRAAVMGPCTVPAGAKIQREIGLTNCHFYDRFDVTKAHFLGNFSLEGSVFERGAAFGFAYIDRNLFADDVSFPNGDAKAGFNGASVGANFFLQRARFAGPANFVGASIGLGLYAMKAEFRNKTSAADFSGVKTTEDVSIADTSFEGGAIFIGARIGYDLSAHRAHFNNKETEASFNGTSVSHSAYFQNATFAGPVDFTGFSAGSSLVASDAEFGSPDQIVSFNTMTIGTHAFFRGTTFQSEVDFAYSTVGRTADFRGAHFNHPAQQVSFFNLKSDEVDFGCNDRLGCAHFEGPLRLDRMSYQHIYAESWPDLLNRANSSVYYPDTYTSIEALFRREGNMEEANKIYMEGRKRERVGQFRKHPLWYTWNVIQDYGAGYGRKLQRALYWSVLFLIFGVVVFWRESGMDLQKGFDDRPCSGRRYHATWYSLALFLPIISLEDAKVWTPKPHRGFARFYMRVHMIFGYLLIPIGLAAWTGIIK